jgi:cellobiose-specific phosphotransferase system component IIB
MFASRKLLGCALLLVSILATRGVASAQSDTGEIVITVVDAQTSEPLGDARAILVGPQTASALTTKAGVIQYTDVPIGIYRVRVLKRGYNGSASAEFDVLPDRSVAVKVALALTTGGLKVIGTVTAKSNVTVSTSDINENSPIRRLSSSLIDALDTVAGVSVTQDATDPNSPVTVSLNGHDESQTSVSLDGIPLSAPGSTANLRAIGTDLFSGSSVSTSPSAGALGGGVNFRTLQPTQSLQIRASGTTGTFDRSNYTLAGTGSVGSLGIALQHSWRGSNSPLTFDDYEDQSGLTYPHEGFSTSLGDFAKFRYRLNDERTSISGTALTNNLDAHAICAQYVTNLPCGIGPSNLNYSRYAFAYGTIQSLVGTVATTLSYYTSASKQNTDDINRYVLFPGSAFGTDTSTETDCEATFSDSGAQLCPSVGNDTSLTRGIAYSASIAQGRHTYTLTGNTYSAVSSNTPTAGSQFETAFTNAISSTSYQLSDAFKSSDQLTLSPRISLVNTTSLGTSVLAGFGASWRPRTADTFAANASVGSSQPSINNNRSFSDPLSARFNCAADTAIVSGPGDSNGGSQSAVSFDTSWTHQFVRSGAQFTADVFSQVQSGQLITAAIAEPASFFPTLPSGLSYLDALDGAFHTAAVCGTGTANPTVYVNEPVAGTRRIYQGVNASARVGIGRFVVLLPTYTLNIAKLTAASPRLEDGPSTTIVGQQLPGRPVHRAGITIDGLLPKSGTELLLNAQYTGANNQQNLGPYATVSAGISHGFGPGRITLFENNVFNTYAGDFATDTYDQPLNLSDGGTFRTSATPLTPRVISLSYTMAIGGPKPGPALASVTSRLAQVTPAPEPSGGPRRGGFGNLQAIPPPAGTDPLSLATTRTSCDATQQTAATPVFAQLKAYVTAYEAKQTLPDVTSFQVIPHEAPAGSSVPYYLEIRPKFARPQGAGAPAADGAEGSGRRGTGGRFGGGGFGGPGGPGGGGPPGGPDGPPPGAEGGAAGQNGEPNPQRTPSPDQLAFRGFISCSYVTVLSSSDAKAKGIVPATTGRPGLYYVPTIGITFVRPPELPTGGGSLKKSS